MRRFGLALVVLFAGVACARAQLTVEVLLDQDQYLRDESLPAKIRITNLSGQRLALGKEDNWLTFLVTTREGHSVARVGEPAVAGEFTLESSMVATRTVDLMPHFDFQQPGRYSIAATVKIPAWNAEHTSKPKHFEIIRGAKLWEQEFGVPAPGGVPELRKYTLQQAMYLKRLTLYVRLTDASEQQVFRVLPAGPLVSFSRPEAQLDQASNLHLLFQTGARSFRYLVITPYGDITARQAHDYTQTRPVLRSGEEGRILVHGGTRRLSPDDLPARTAAVPSQTNDLGAAKP